MPIPAVDLHSALTGDTPASVKPNYPFLLVHWAGKMGSWELVDGKDGPELLPVVASVPLQPGTNHFRGAEVGEDPSVPLEEAMQALRREGAIVLSPRAEIAGVRWLASTKTAGGGYRWRLWCETVEPNPFPGRKDLVSVDVEAYNAWRRRLVVEGIVPPIHPAVKRAMESAATAARDRWRGNIRVGQELREVRLAHYTAQVAALEAARMPGDPVPAAATKSRKEAASV